MPDNKSKEIEWLNHVAVLATWDEFIIKFEISPYPNLPGIGIMILDKNGRLLSSGYIEAIVQISEVIHEALKRVNQ